MSTNNGTAAAEVLQPQGMGRKSFDSFGSPPYSGPANAQLQKASARNNGVAIRLADASGDLVPAIRLNDEFQPSERLDNSKSQRLREQRLCSPVHLSLNPPCTMPRLPLISAFRTLVLSALLCGLNCFAATDEVPVANIPTPSRFGVDFFETQVRPLLTRRCSECHSTETGAENGGLILESAEGIASGGSRGPMISKDNPEKSLLLHAVDYLDPELQMPPEGRLPADELEILRHWVRDGAALPEYKLVPRPPSHSIDFEAGREFWSFRPLAAVTLPDVADPDWVRVPMDSFVLAKLLEHRLTPNPEADRAILLRRLSFDVIGLPPTPDEIAAFVLDESPDAVEEVVDRLLASPHYGERWARVWLDLARYTDFTPDWQNPTDRGWIYRDWVVQALNDNMPYDRFVRLQLAADLLPDVDLRDLAALGFLGLSPTYWKELRLAPPVIEQIVADEWDERIDAVSRTFLGLTVSCARCHDHKFDPVSTEDYYALAGIFASTQLEERPMLPDAEAKVVRAAREQVKQLEAKLKPLEEQKSPESDALRQQIDSLKKGTPHFDGPFAHVLRDASVHVLPEGDELTKLEYREGQARDLPVFRRGNPANPGDIVPRRFLSVFLADESSLFNHGSGRAQLAEALLNEARGLTARVIVNRIWDQHFSAGLVRTPSDFGTQGDRPTHPELLEYLAAEFVRRDWDLKWLHREILLSAAYRQSSAFRDDANAADPDNRLLWRANRRRLDFEMWRDATLAVSGQLDLSLGGPSRPVDDLNNVRRTLYVTIDREELHPMLRMHDFPEASSHSPRREPTTTPLQQLFVLNSPWMEKQTVALFETLKPIMDDDERLDRVYRGLFSRSPEPHEMQIAKQFLRPTGGEPDVDTPVAGADGNEVRWKDYLQALLGLNEFHFVD